MSHTYTSCYKVTVPPIDIWHSSRRSGVRLRESCYPLSELRDFETLYLPQQLRADYLEKEAIANHQPLPHAPGWLHNTQTNIDEAISRHEAQQAANNASTSTFGVANDFGLNGGLASKTRHAIRHEFFPTRGADGSYVFGVCYQRGVHETRKDKMNAGSGNPTDEVDSEPLKSTGLPYWLSNGAMELPRSTTHSTYRAIPEESFLLDQRFFHGSSEELPPATPSWSNSKQRLRTPHPVMGRNSVRRISLVSNENPSLFFRVPEVNSHPEFWRKSAVLRKEWNDRLALQSAAKNRKELQQATQQQQQEKQPEESKEETRVWDLRPHTGSASARPLHRQSQPGPAAPAGAFTARPPRPSPPTQSMPRHVRTRSSPLSPSAASSSSNAVGKTDGFDSTKTLSKFQQHMHEARQRWTEQGLMQEESGTR